MRLPQDPKTRTLVMLVGLVLTMGSLSFAAVPFYSWFCRVTGYAGTPLVAKAAPGGDRVLDRTITVRFDGNVEAGMPWIFKPVEREMTLRIGETGLAFFRATNTSGRVVAGTAAFNVSPDQAGRFFEKIDCFCFTQQILQPGETVDMPVSFFVDPSMVEDAEATFINHITLSYTFYESSLPEEQASLLPVKSDPVN
jgi:cytochrome c oxidase assembly protein subunit 11